MLTQRSGQMPTNLSGFRLPSEVGDAFTIWPGEIEVRARGKGRELRAYFPLGKTATIRSGGRVRKERFMPDSMSWQVREFQKLQAEMARVVESAVEEARRELLIEQLEDALERRNTHLLVGHSYDKAVADMRSGSLAVDFTDEAVSLRATLAAEGDAPSWVEDAVKAVRGGQLRGISPGFQVGAKGRERLVPEEGNPAVMVREIQDAVVFEYSLVSRPTYASTEATVRGDVFPMVKPKRRALWWL